MYKALFFLVVLSYTVSASDKPVNEITCYIDGTLTQLFFDASSDAEGQLNTGEFVVARSIEWTAADMPELSMLKTIAMKVEFPFRLEGKTLDCEVYHPSWWWFNQLEVFEGFAPKPTIH